MILLISPAKTMKEECRHTPLQRPIFIEQSKQILHTLQTYKIEDIKMKMKVSDVIAQQCLQRYADMKFDMQGYCALDAYDGMQFKSMHIPSLTASQRAYLDSHLRILSGFYGIVHPSDSIYPYRLEMQTALSVAGSRNLYDFWKDSIAKQVRKECRLQGQPFILNLASKEYERAIRPYIPTAQWVDIHFYTEEKGTYTARSTQVKKARGSMVRYMAEHNIEEVEELQHVMLDGYQYHAGLSEQNALVFVKGESK